MPNRDIVVIGGSAGGIEALRALFRALPPRLPAALFVAVHLPEDVPSQLASLLDRAGPLPAQVAVDGALFSPGHVYVARPGLHLTIEKDRLRVDAGPRENGFRPAIDRLFRSAALVHGARVIGVVLSGMRDDGTAGLASIKRGGGIALVQDPSDALFPAMPTHAIQNVAVDHVLSVVELARVLAHRVTDVVTAVVAEPDTIEGAPAPSMEQAERTFACPDCGGVLIELQGSQPARFRCRIGHEYGTESLLQEQGNHVEEALSAALNALLERRDFSRRMGRNARERGLTSLANRCDSIANEAEQSAAAIRAVLTPRSETPRAEPAPTDRDA